MNRDHFQVRYAGLNYRPAPDTAEEHRAQALRLLATAENPAVGDVANRIAAAQVHATLALTAPEATGTPEEVCGDA